MIFKRQVFRAEIAGKLKRQTMGGNNWELLIPWGDTSVGGVELLVAGIWALEVFGVGDSFDCWWVEDEGKYVIYGMQWRILHL